MAARVTLLRVREAFYALGRVYRPGEIIPSNDPVVVGREALFVAGPVIDGVEQATAAPGEKRAIRVPKG